MPARAPGRRPKRPCPEVASCAGFSFPLLPSYIPPYDRRTTADYTRLRTPRVVPRGAFGPQNPGDLCDRLWGDHDRPVLEWFYGALVGYGTFRWAVENRYIDYSTHVASVLVAFAVLFGGIRIVRRGDTRLFSPGLIACTTLAVAPSLLHLPRVFQSGLPPDRVTATAANLLLGTASAIVVFWMTMGLVQFSKTLQNDEPHARTETWRRIHRATAWLVIVPPLAKLLGTAAAAPQVSIGISTWQALGFSATFVLAGVAFCFRLPRAWLVCTALAVMSVPAPLISWCVDFRRWQQWKTGQSISAMIDAAHGAQFRTAGHTAYDAPNAPAIALSERIVGRIA